MSPSLQLYCVLPRAHGSPFPASPFIYTRSELGDCRMFLNRPKMDDTGKRVGGRVIYRLAEDLVFETKMNCQGIRVVVPAGSESDLASAPWWLWWIFPPSGPWDLAAILHDYLYGLIGVSRFLADALMREAMAQLGLPVWRRVLAFYCLRLFGRSHHWSAKGKSG